MNCRKFMLMTAAVFTAAVLFADTFYWKGTSGVPGRWNALSNWSTEGASGADADRLPGASDVVNSPLGNFSYATFLLSDDVAVGGFRGYYRYFVFRRDPAASDGRVTVSVPGVFNETAYQHFVVDSGVDVRLVAGSTFHLAGSDAGRGSVTVNEGGRFLVQGAVDGRHYDFNVNAGGELEFAPTSYVKLSDPNNANMTDRFTVRGGTLSLPQGLSLQSGTAGRTNLITVTSGGTVCLGGNVSCSPMRYRLGLTDSVLSVTDDAVLTEGVDVVLSGTSAVDVASGRRLALGSLVVSDGASLVKRGGGTLALDRDLPASVVLQAGKLEVNVPDAVLAGRVEGDGPVAVVLGAKGFVYAAEGPATVAFSLADNVFRTGDVVLTSARADILAKAQADLMSFGRNVSIEGSSLRLVPHETDAEGRPVGFAVHFLW